MPHYFDQPAAGPAPRRHLTVELAGEPADVVTAAGVFSASRLDLGSAVLLRTEMRLARAALSDAAPLGSPVNHGDRSGSAPSTTLSDAAPLGSPVNHGDRSGTTPSSDRVPTQPPDTGRRAEREWGDGIGQPKTNQRNLLDLGCGWGPLALTLARLEPVATVWAVDTNPRALELTTQNATRLGLTNIKTALPPDLPPTIKFDLIWSNPPIRIGKPALHQLLHHWLSRMTPAGWADLVVQKNLGADSLARWLQDEAGFDTVKLASAKGYRVWRIKRAE
ncbi:MAG: methyltransferase [Bifidobacteriaceae bacterium]|jgi:16S rRNA G1207 methylase RsmC|nr:methyltransferase [Bifidobacteriaceae bacterium]